jgi:four helix bundle protein
MLAPFEELRVWKLSHQLALEVYKVTARFPSSERYGLTSQLRRAAITVIANIAEGNARNYRREYLQYLHIARGSIAEIKCLLRVSRDLQMQSEGEYETLLSGYNQAGKMLQALINRLGAS